jgi:hypothetical protein
VLILAGPNITAYKDYTRQVHLSDINIESTQGDTHDTLQITMHDPTRSNTVVEEDEFIICDESDPAGFPTVNLLLNPSLEPPYTSGVPASWITTTLPSGVVLSQQTGATAIFNSSCLKFTFTAVASSASFTFYQQVVLPVDENNSPLLDLPYYASSWFMHDTAAITGLQVAIKIGWYDSSNTLLSTVSSALPISSLTASIWQRAFAAGTPPANTISARIQVTCTTTASYTGVLYLDGTQFERATAATHSSIQYQPPLLNSQMQYHGLAGVVDGWTVASQSSAGSKSVAQNAALPLMGGTGGAYANVTSPVLYGASAQQIQIVSGTAPSLWTIQQATFTMPISPFGTYTLSMRYRVTGAFTNGASVVANIQIWDSSQVLLSSYYANSDINPPISPTWQTLTLTCGVNTANPLPATAAYITVSVGIDSRTAVHATGTLVIGAATLTAASWQFAHPNVERLALAAGQYPTAFTDPSNSAVYLDLVYALYYRQLRYFGGYVRDKQYLFGVGPERSVLASAVDFGVLLSEAPTTLILTNVSDVQAIAAIMGYAQTQGFCAGLDVTTFVTSAAPNALSFSWSWSNARDALNAVCNAVIGAQYVDFYKRLHYGSALSQNAPFGFSDTPDLVNTFPIVQFVYEGDSTQSRTSSIIEGSTQQSAPVTENFTGSQTTLTAGLTSGTTYTSLTVTALTHAIPALAVLQIGTTPNQQVVVAAVANIGATSITVQSFIANNTYAPTVVVAVVGWAVNLGSPIVSTDSVTLATVAQTVGSAATQSFSAGYQVLANYDTATYLFATAPANGAAVAITYRYSAPIIIRVHSTASESPTGAIRRKIHSYTKDTTITSVAAALLRAQSDLTQYQKSRPLATLTTFSPPAPPSTPLRVGTAVAVTHSGANLVNQLFQIVDVKTYIIGPFAIQFDLQLGFYRPDTIVLLAQSVRLQAAGAVVATPGSVLSDVLAATDGWTLTDAISNAVSNIGTWDGASTWDGPYTWT